MEKSAILMAQVLSPEYPWNNIKPEDLGPCVMKFMEDHEPFYKRWAEQWFNNFQFIYGNQSIRWGRRYGYAVDSDFLSRLPSINMRAQTNMSRVVVEALSSMIYANLPEWAAEMAENSSVKGKRFKKIVQKILDAYMVRLCMDQEFSAQSIMYAVYGQVASIAMWDKKAGQILDIPKWQKIKAPVFTDYMAPNAFTNGLLEVPTQALNSQGQPFMEDRWEPMLDAMGRQIVDKVFAGDVRVWSLSPFEYRREIGSQGMHNTKYVQWIRLMDYDQWLDEYGDVEGKTPLSSSIKPVYANPGLYRIAMRHFMRMQYTTPPGLSEIYQRPDNVYSQNLIKNKVLVVEHFDKPHHIKWPSGRRVVVTNGECTHITVPDYHTNKRDGWHPFNEAQWLAIGPSSIATGPLNDVISKNRELNVADSLIATALRRNMGSQLLVKAGQAIDPQRFTGEPGVVHEVPDPFALRWLHDDMPISPVVEKFRQNSKDDIYETSGAGDALRGERPPNVSSGYALRQLQEREEKRLSAGRKRWEFFVSGQGEKIFTCLKQNVRALDKDVMGFCIRSAAGEFQPQDVVALLSSSIDFGIDVKVEESSMALKSKATLQATIQEMAQNPAVAQRLQQDAKVLDEYLKIFDAEALRDQSSTHRDRASRENETFADMLRLGPDLDGVTRPVVLFEDDDDLHIAEHTQFLLQNSDDITKNEPFFIEFMMHMERHRLQKGEKEATLMPGTSLQTPNMMGAAMQQQPPNVQMIYQKSMMDLQQKQSQPPPSPQAPSQPAPAGSKGPPQTDTQAPSQNTSPANQGGNPQ